MMARRKYNSVTLSRNEAGVNKLVDTQNQTAIFPEAPLHAGLRAYLKSH
jgi:hypothetical protein